MHTKYAHTQTNIYAEHREQHTDRTQNNLSTEHKIHNTEQNAQPQHTEQNTYYLHTYSFDLYYEFAYIKNSNTIELYTILQDKV